MRAGAIDATLIAVTLQVASEGCWTIEPRICHDFTGPLRMWSSADGLRWTERPSPISPDPSWPLDDYNAPALVVTDQAFLLVSNGTTVSVARSTDGMSWSAVAPDDGPRPPRFDARSVARLGSSVIGIGETTANDDLAAVIWDTTDGATWVSTTLPNPYADVGVGTAGGRFESGADGVLAMGGQAGDGGSSIWWAIDGGEWTSLADFPPLGVWFGEGAGGEGAPDGFVLGDGSRLLAYRGGDSPVAWHSTDALAWTPIDVEGAAPEVGNGGDRRGELYLTSLGLLLLGEDGSAWFAEPFTD